MAWVIAAMMIGCRISSARKTGSMPASTVKGSLMSTPRLMKSATRRGGTTTMA